MSEKNSAFILRHPRNFLYFREVIEDISRTGNFLKIQSSRYIRYAIMRHNQCTFNLFSVVFINIHNKKSDHLFIILDLLFYA